MMEAMARARVGDDVLGDDPTVQELEVLAAEMSGHEAAVFVPSGTMGNQIAIATHCQRGDALIAEQEAHIIYYEVGAPAVLAGALTITLPSQRGTMDPTAIEARIMKSSLHTPGTKLVCLENTHNRAGGAVVPVSNFVACRELCDRNGLQLHLDGARLFNAAVAIGRPIREYTQYVDSVSLCLSKGLRSPVGSVLCGSRDFVEGARIWRKRVGGGMRQSGLLAACGIVSLTKMIDRLAEDHDRAKRLATELKDVPGLHVDLASVETNMVLVGVPGSVADWVRDLAAEGVWALSPGPGMLRLVLHADIDDAGIQRASLAFRRIARGASSPESV